MRKPWGSPFRSGSGACNPARRRYGGGSPIPPALALIVQKYGGTSVGNTERIVNVARRVLESAREGNQVVAVVSAMGGVTDRLIGLAKEVTDDPTPREMDVLLATGEQTSIALVAMAINAMGGRAVSLTGPQAGFMTDDAHTRARILDIRPEQVHAHIEAGEIVIVAGFQGRCADGRLTTLGRGGSDLTAIALAAALRADLCQIFTDVDGVYTCDPRIVPDARKLAEISYDEMLELASSGAKVMQARSVEFAKKFGVLFEVRHSMKPDHGTLVREEHPNMEAVVIRGISLERDQAKLTLNDVPDVPGTAFRVFRALGDADVNVDMIVQNTSRDELARISFTVHRNDLPRARAALAPVLAAFPGARREEEAGIVKLSAVGIGMRSHSGVAADMFEALSAAGINIQMISTSEIKIAVTIPEDRAEEAARVVHAAFGLGKK
jgi:aspartate kinase